MGESIGQQLHVEPDLLFAAAVHRGRIYGAGIDQCVSRRINFAKRRNLVSTVGVENSQHTTQGTSMYFFRWLSDWAFTRLFWLCLLCGTAQADVILWGQGVPADPANTPYIIKPGESRTQRFFYKDPFEVRSVKLHVQDNPLSSGMGRVTVWLAGESIYSGPAVTSITGLSKRLDAGWHPLTVVGIENQSQWVGSAGNSVASEFNGAAAPGLNLYVSGMSLVPEPSVAVPSLIVAAIVAAGAFWRRICGK